MLTRLPYIWEFDAYSTADYILCEKNTDEIENSDYAIRPEKVKAIKQAVIEKIMLFGSNGRY